MELKSHQPTGKETKQRRVSRADTIYQQIKEEIFNFQLLPGDKFSENEVAERMQASRTPVREALYRLQREGYVNVLFRSGWQVRPFDFETIEDLYDIRIILELAAIKKLCELDTVPTLLNELRAIWIIPESERMDDFPQLSKLDERFHETLVEATGNVEMARMHHDVTERIRVVRRLDFTKEARVEATYNEHAAILRAILQRRGNQAQLLMKTHIEESKAEVRKITLHMIHEARRQLPR